MRSQVQLVYDALKGHPDGLTVVQVAKAINKGRDVNYSNSSVNMWLKEAAKQGVVSQEAKTPLRRGRPAQLFRLKEA